MKILNGKELFEMLYDNKIKEDECIEVIHPQEKDHYLLRKGYCKRFEDDELMSTLLFTEYRFKIRKQDRVEKYLEERDKTIRIDKLEKELARLKGEPNERNII